MALPLLGADGRFLTHLNASAASEDLPRRQIVIVQHWFEELNARMRSTATVQ